MKLTLSQLKPGQWPIPCFCIILSLLPFSIKHSAGFLKAAAPDTLFCRMVTKPSIVPQRCLVLAHWMKEQRGNKRGLQEILWSGLATQQVLEQVWSWLRHVAGNKGIARVLNRALLSNNSEHLAQNLRFHTELNSHTKKTWVGCQGHALLSIFRSLFP